MTRQTTVASGQVITAAHTNTQSAAIDKTSQLMTPTSVSAGSIGTYGAVTFSAAAAVSLNGVFTSEFDWYDVVFDVATSGAAYNTLALRLSGTDATTAYDRQITNSENATTTTAQSLNQSNWRITSTTVTGKASGTIRLFSPAIAAQTTGTALTGSAANPMTSTTGSVYSGYLSHRTAAAYDGLTIAPSTGNITGTIRVYGII